MSEYIWSEHAKQRAEERFSGVNLDIELLAAKRLGKKARSTVRRLCPVSAAKWMSSGFVGRYCLKAKSGIVFVMQAPNTVVTVFKIGEVVELSENELRQNLEINSLEQRLAASEAELKQALQLLASVQRELAELKEKHRWIPVTERLPEQLVAVLVIDQQMAYPNELPVVANWDGSEWATGMLWEPNVTHWMPLPEPKA